MLPIKAKHSAKSEKSDLLKDRTNKAKAKCTKSNTGRVEARQAFRVNSKEPTQSRLFEDEKSSRLIKSNAVSGESKRANPTSRGGVSGFAGDRTLEVDLSLTCLLVLDCLMQ